MWNLLMQMSGQNCFTLTQDRPAKISVNLKEVMIHYPSGRSLPIPRQMLETAWNKLKLEGRLTDSDTYEITEGHGWRKDRTDRILAVIRMLPGVTYDKSPRVLYFEK